MFGPNLLRAKARGNVFALLFGAVALTGVLAAVGMQTLTGPVTTITRVTQKNIAETNLLMNAKIISNAVPLNGTDGSIDTDAEREPHAMIAAASGETPPANGGYLPTTLGLTLTDPWGSKYGYCVYDHGAEASASGYIPGDDSGTNTVRVQPLFGVISSGPDKVFQTGCPVYTTGQMDLKKASGSDDLVQAFTYSEAEASAGGLWNLKSPTEQNIAQLKDSSGSAVNVSIDRDTGVGDFVGLTTDTLAAKTDNIAIDGGLKVDVLGSETCDGTTEGVLRFDAGTEKTLVVCNGTLWVPAGGTVWTRDGTSVRLKEIGDSVGIGIAVPTAKLDVVGNTKISGNTAIGGTGDVTGNFTVGTDALSVAASGKMVGIGKATPTVALDVVGDTLLTGEASVVENFMVGTDVLFVDTNVDRVGINNAAPEHDLDIIGGTTIGTVGALDEANAVVRIQENPSGPNLYMDGNTIITDATMLVGSIGNAGIQMLANSLVAFSIDAAGTSNAVNTLNVGGALNVSGAATMNSTLQVTGNTSVDTNTFFVDATSNSVGIGTASPAARLDVDGGIKLGVHQAGTSCTPDGVIQYNGSRMEICIGGTWQGVSAIDQLDDIGDVDVPTPLDGEVLAWDDSANKWVNKNIALLGPAAVDPAGVDGSVQFKDGSDLGADAANFHYDKTNHRLGLGTNTPGYTLDVTGTGNVSTDFTVGRDLFVTRHTALTGNLTVDATTLFVSSVNNNVGIGTASPHNSALLDLTSTTGGLLPPRMNVTQRNAITAPSTGLMLYNTSNNKLQIWDGTDWLNVGVASGLGQTMIEGWPDAINCGNANYPSVYYLTYAPLQADGRFYYRNILDSANYSIIFNADRTYYDKTGTAETGCVTKSINTLYAEGRAFNFVGGSQAGEGGSMVTDVPDALDCGISGTQRFLFLQSATVTGYTYAFSGGANGIGMQVSYNALPAGTHASTTNTAGWTNANGCDGKTLTQLASEDRAFFLVGGSDGSGAGAPPAGADGYIQFNTSNALDADSALTFNKVLDRLILGGGIKVGNDTTCAVGGADNGTFRFNGTKPQYCYNGTWLDTGVQDGDKTDITVSASGATFIIDPQAVTFSKIQNLSSNVVLGRGGSAGSTQELTLGAGLSITGTTLNTTAAGVADGDKGDITVSSSGSSWNIDADAVGSAEIATGAVGTSDIADAAVTYAKLQDVAAARLLGRYTASAGAAQEISIGAGLLLNATTGVLSAAATSGVAGNDTEVQFNDGGALGADADMTWNKTTNRLTIAATATTGFVKSGQLELTPIAAPAPIGGAGGSGSWSSDGTDVWRATGNVGIGTATPNANALLDLTSTSKAFLPPRMTGVQRNAIASPVAGMTVYNSTTGTLDVFAPSMGASNATPFWQPGGGALRALGRGTSGDYNNIIQDVPGGAFWMDGPGSANGPSGVTSGSLLQFDPLWNDATSKNKYSIQLATNGNSANLYYRGQVNGTWGSWVTLGGGGGSLTGGTSGYLGVWSGATTMGLSGTAAGQNLFWDGANHRLGLGTTAPLSRLDLASTTAANTSLLRFRSVAAGMGIDYAGLQHDDFLMGSRVVGGYPLHYLSFGYTGDGGRKFQIGSADSSTFASANFVPHFTVQADGKIGIGNASPTYQLQIGTGVQEAKFYDTNGTIELEGQNADATTFTSVFAQHGTNTTRGIFTVDGNFGAGTTRKSALYVRGDGRVGMGTTAPVAEGLEIAGLSNAASDPLMVLHSYKGTSVTSGMDGKQLAFASGNTNVTYMGTNTTLTGGAMSAFSYFYINAMPANATQVYVDPDFVINNSSNVGIGTTTPNAKFHVNGGAIFGNATAGGTLSANGVSIDSGQGRVYITRSVADNVMEFNWQPTATRVGSIGINASSTAYNATSDERLKENIVPTAHGIDDLMRIHVKDYNFKSDADKITQQGFIAQDLYKVYPQAVTPGDTGAEVKDPWQVDYGKVTPLLVKAVQEIKDVVDGILAKIKELFDLVGKLQAENAALRAEVDTLKTQNTDILKRLDAIEEKQ